MLTYFVLFHIYMQNDGIICANLCYDLFRLYKAKTQITKVGLPLGPLCIFRRHYFWH